MKHINNFPILQMRGSDGRSDGRVYYVHNSNQISRKYVTPTIDINHSFVSSREVLNVILSGWRNLNSSDLSLLESSFKEFCRLYPNEKTKYNLYTYYTKINYYFVLKYGFCSPVPAVPDKSKKMISCSAYGLAENPDYIMFNMTFNKELEENSLISVSITKPYSNYIHAYRENEKKLICGYSSESLFSCSDISVNKQISFNNLCYPVSVGDYFYITARVIDGDGFPNEESLISVQVKDRCIMESLGELYKSFNLAHFLGSPENYAQQYSADPSNNYVKTWENESKFYIPVIYYPGSIIKRFRICANQTGNEASAYKLEFLKRDLGLASAEWILISSTEGNFNGLGIRQNINIENINHTIDPGFSYVCRFSVTGNVSEIQLQDFTEYTIKRVY